MLIRLKIPKTIMWVINLLFIFLLIFTLFRVATYFSFKPKDLGFKELIPSFLLGIRYDLRWIAIILLPIITFIVFFFFAADFGNFAYNRTRLNASALNFWEDAKISMTMLWQSYP